MVTPADGPGSITGVDIATIISQAADAAEIGSTLAGGVTAGVTSGAGVWLFLHRSIESIRGELRSVVSSLGALANETGRALASAEPRLTTLEGRLSASDSRSDELDKGIRALESRITKAEERLKSGREAHERVRRDIYALSAALEKAGHDVRSEAFRFAVKTGEFERD